MNQRTIHLRHWSLVLRWRGLGRHVQRPCIFSAHPHFSLLDSTCSDAELTALSDCHLAERTCIRELLVRPTSVHLYLRHQALILRSVSLSKPSAFTSISHIHIWDLLSAIHENIAIQPCSCCVCNLSSTLSTPFRCPRRCRSTRLFLLPQTVMVTRICRVSIITRCHLSPN